MLESYTCEKKQIKTARRSPVFVSSLQLSVQGDRLNWLAPTRPCTGNDAAYVARVSCLVTNNTWVRRVRKVRMECRLMWRRGVPPPPSSSSSSSSTSTSVYTPYAITVKQNTGFYHLCKFIKNKMIPLHKYSYPYLRQLKFSSGAFILSEGNQCQIQVNEYDLERDTRLNKRSNSW